MQTDEEIGFFLEKRRGEKEDVIYPLEHTQPLVFYLMDIHIVICSMYYSSVCVLDWNGSAFKQLRHMSLMKQENSRLW